MSEGLPIGAWTRKQLFQCKDHPSIGDDLKKAVVLEWPARLSVSSVEWIISSPQALLVFIYPCGWAMWTMLISGAF